MNIIFTKQFNNHLMLYLSFREKVFEEYMKTREGKGSQCMLKAYKRWQLDAEIGMVNAALDSIPAKSEWWGPLDPMELMRRTYGHICETPWRRKLATVVASLIIEFKDAEKQPKQLALAI